MHGRKPVGKSGKGSCGEKGGKGKGKGSYQWLRRRRAGVKYALRVRLGQDGRLTRIRPLMLIWPHPSIARTRTTPRSPKVVKAKGSNGSTQTMERSELGKDRT